MIGKKMSEVRSKTGQSIAVQRLSVSTVLHRLSTLEHPSPVVLMRPVHFEYRVTESESEGDSAGATQS